MIFLDSGTCAARPAKFILTERASHVIAALILFNPRVAHGTHRYIIFILFRPALELTVHSVLARYVFVPHISTPEAYPGVASQALQLLRFI